MIPYLSFLKCSFVKYRLVWVEREGEEGTICRKKIGTGWSWVGLLISLDLSFVDVDYESNELNTY